MNKKIKVCVDARTLYDTANGVSRYLRKSIQTILSNSDEFEFFLISNRDIHFEHHKKEYYEIIIDDQYTFLPGTIWLQLFATKIARKKNADIFWGPAHILPAYKSKKLKYVLTMHDLVADIMPKSMQYVNLIASKILNNRSLKVADCIICDSQTTLKDMQHFYPFTQNKNVKVIYLGTSLDNVHIKYDINQDYNFKFLFVIGSLEPRKNIFNLIKTFELILKKRPDLKLIITGAKRWKSNKILNYIEKNNLSNSVIFSGYLSDEDLIKHLHASEAFVFPSIYEGFGLPLIEAEGKAKAIVSDIEIFRELGNYLNQIYFCDFQENLSKSADEIIQIIEQNKKNVLEFRSKQFKEMFTWEHSADKLIESFKDVLN